MWAPGRNKPVPGGQGGKGFVEEPELELAGVCEVGTEVVGRKGVGRAHSRSGTLHGPDRGIKVTERGQDTAGGSVQLVCMMRRRKQWMRRWDTKARAGSQRAFTPR